MKEKQIKIPGPDHPISIQRNRARVVVSVAGRVIADTRNALTLLEADYSPVQYVPHEDPYSAVAQIKGHVAFYPERVDEIAEQLPTTRESSKSSHTKKG